MRTKTLLIAAATLAAGLATSMAQNVYSQNVVGYVNKAFANGNAYMISNPLQNGTNGLGQIIANPPDGTSILRWNVGLQDLDPAVPIYFTDTGTWIPDAQLAPGEGFMLVASGGAFTNTFVGEVLQGALTIPILGGGNAQLLGSKVPQAGALSTILTSYPASDGDNVLLWSVSLQDVDPAVPIYFTDSSSWIPNPNLEVADGFLLISVGGATNWTRNFTVN